MIIRLLLFDMRARLQIRYERYSGVAIGLAWRGCHEMLDLYTTSAIPHGHPRNGGLAIPVSRMS
jgi:hypothetical protein